VESALRTISNLLSHPSAWSGAPRDDILKALLHVATVCSDASATNLQFILVKTLGLLRTCVPSLGRDPSGKVAAFLASSALKLYPKLGAALQGGVLLEATLFLADSLNLVRELPRGTEVEKHETAVLTFKQAMASGVESQLCKTLEAAGKSGGEPTLYSFGHASRAIGRQSVLR
jgi:hypothetical protein